MTSKNRRRYLSPTTLVVAMIVLAIGTVTVASRQQSRTVNDNKAFAETHANVESSKVVAQDSPLSFQDDQGSRTPEEAARLAEGLGQVIDQSTEGLVQIQHADGSVSMNLEDHFQNVTVARVDQRGNLAQSCVDNPQAAGAFFRINPELIKSQRRTARTTNQE
ncbi:MAG TPA: hypothetical protein VJU86_02930 [Pyrinomonadaceae bacterium]|nr:hypothetical protein [Pyrinomonadaceae bacterium]